MDAATSAKGPNMASVIVGRVGPSMTGVVWGWREGDGRGREARGVFRKREGREAVEEWVMVCAVVSTVWVGLLHTM